MRNALSRIRRRQAIVRTLDDVITFASLAAFTVAVFGLAIGFGA
jgi:hypothetical protein